MRWPRTEPRESPSAACTSAGPPCCRPGSAPSGAGSSRGSAPPPAHSPPPPLLLLLLLLVVLVLLLLLGRGGLGGGLGPRGLGAPTPPEPERPFFSFSIFLLLENSWGRRGEELYKDGEAGKRSLDIGLVASQDVTCSARCVEYEQRGGREGGRVRAEQRCTAVKTITSALTTAAAHFINRQGTAYTWKRSRPGMVCTNPR